MKKVAIALALCMALSVILGGVALAAGPQYANGKADLQPFGGEKVDGSRGRGVINYNKEAENWQFQLNVWGLDPNTTYYVVIGDMDWNWIVPVGSFDTNVLGNGSFHAVLSNGVNRIAVLIAPTTANSDCALCTWDGTTDNITWNPSNR